MAEYVIEIPDYVPPFDPAVRAVSLGEEVVRCRDCEHYLDQINCCGWFTEHTYQLVDPNGFCSWGERREQ